MLVFPLFDSIIMGGLTYRPTDGPTNGQSLLVACPELENKEINKEREKERQTDREKERNK